MIKLKIKVGISNRHVHLKREDLNILFGENYNLTMRNPLSQTGEFASNETVSIKTSKDKIDGIRVLGPIRDYTQVEISKTDSYKLGINPPVRQSGDLYGAETVEIIGPKGSIVAKESTIIAERHIHINTNDLESYGFKDGETVKVKIDGIKGGIIENVKIKSKMTYTFELHLDTDEGNAFLLNNGDVVTIIKGD